MLHAVTVRAVKLRGHDAALNCERLHGIGFAWRCSCGEQGPIVGTHRLARSAGREHRETAAEITPRS